MTRRFTGWHMTAIMLLFFGTIITVNVTMAVFATTTFGGKVVENSYVASQKYNDWLAAARAQQRLGWTHKASLDGERHLIVQSSVRGARIEAVARHPLGREAERALRFAGENGRFRSLEPLPSGRWIVHLTVASGAEQARYIETVQ
jgi:nitrogen fixation protein FixH